MGYHHRHPFREYPRGGSKAKRQISKLKVLLAHCALQVTPVGRQDGYMEICSLQVQCYHPVSRVHGRQDLSQREHFELLLFQEVVERVYV